MDECKHFCNQLSDYLDGEVTEDECRLIEEHLDVCPPCLLVYESLKTTVTICGQAVPADLPEHVRAELKAFLRKHCTQE
ncbi:MAG TPA: anti-sigma factor [Desulfomonilaceae bacterium]|nr:anti-sigma factor [Desulfomonilaceae bacterium]